MNDSESSPSPDGSSEENVPVNVHKDITQGNCNSNEPLKIKPLNRSEDYMLLHIAKSCIYLNV